MGGAVNIDTKGVGEAIGGIGKTVLDIGKGIKTLITGKLDPELEAQIEQRWLELENAALAQQNRINEIEAASPRFLIAGARPAAIWVCVLIMFNNYILAPYLRAFGVLVPELDMGAMYPIITGLLGLGGMRSYEKIKGAAGRH